MSELTSRERTLVALGAAIASNCVPCVEYHIPEARKAGRSERQIREGVMIADKVRRVPSRTVLRAAVARIGEGPNGQEAAAEVRGAECPCDQPTAA